MKKYPGKTEIVKAGTIHRYVLNDEQKKWFVRWFPVTENGFLAKAMGVGRTKVIEFAQEMGLKKSEEGLIAIRRRRAVRATKTNHKNGCFDRKRGHPVSEATMEGLRKRWQREREGLQENAIVRMRRENPEKYAAMMEKRIRTRRENVRKEKMRVAYGLPRKTKMKEVVICPYRKSQNHHRLSAYRRGYVLAADCSEGNPDRYIIYYDKDTKRSERFEENCRKDGFQIRQWV